MNAKGVNVDSDDLVNEEEFLVSGPLWFVGNKVRLANVGEFASTLCRVATSSGKYIKAFTDLAQAEAFVAPAGLTSRPTPAKTWNACDDS